MEDTEKHPIVTWNVPEIIQRCVVAGLQIMFTLLVQEIARIVDQDQVSDKGKSLRGYLAECPIHGLMNIELFVLIFS